MTGAADANAGQTANGAPLARQTDARALFASVLETYTVDGHETLNPLLLAEVAAIKAADDGITSSNRLGWHSDRDLFKRREPGLSRLAQAIRQALVAAARRYLPDYDPGKAPMILEGWINVSEQHSFNALHHHARHHLSGCYYVNTPKRSEQWSGVLEFRTPIGGLTASGDLGRRMSPDRFAHVPQSGALVIFPSYLLHWVYPNQEDEDRVSIAFNAIVPLA